MEPIEEKTTDLSCAVYAANGDVDPNAKLKLGVSSCLLGSPVRYDGGHKRDRWLVDVLGEFVDFAPVCPEVECGLPVPREAMRLVGDPESPRLITRDGGVDHTEKMQNWGREKVKELEKENLCGFVFKSKSPSSGMERVKVYNGQGMPSQAGVGIFARLFMEHFPLLPVEEEGRLNDAVLRESFIERIFVFKRWRDMVAAGKSLAALIDFHARHKLLLLSHDAETLKEMGALVAEGKQLNVEDLHCRYLHLLNKALAERSTKKKHVNVLQHAMGFFKDDLSADEKQEMLEVIGNYADGFTPLIVPVTLINHYVRKYGVEYLAQQVYLRPHPIELRLRNHV